MRTSVLFSSLRFVASAATVLAVACGGSDSPSPAEPVPGPTGPLAPSPITSVTAGAASSSVINVTFMSRFGDTRYNIERAEGAGGSFSAVGSVDAPASPTRLTFSDAGLKAATLYRYRVFAVSSGGTSAPSSETSTTTLAVPVVSGTADITADITTNRTFFPETTYTLRGFIHVTNGATLTILPGTTIRGDFNTVGSALFIMRGARIVANGRADAPIVFTSSRPLGQRQPGDWGGLIIVGNGTTNRSGSVILDATGSDGATVVSGKNYQVPYSGGSIPTDNSGSMSYVRVEFAGHAPSADAERGAITFAAVGSGTRVSYLQTMASLDDGFSFFGGALDGDHLVAYESGDDMFDMTEGFSGRLQYLIGYNSLALTPRAGAGLESSDISGIESDGCFGTGCSAGFNQQPFTQPLIANFTLIGCGNRLTCGGTVGGSAILVRRGSAGLFVNGIAARFPTAGVSLRDLETYTRTGSVQTPDLTLSDLLLRNIYFVETGSNLFQVSLAAPQDQFALDLSSNALVVGSAIPQSLFTAMPGPLQAPLNVSELDWTPPASSAIVTGGMSTLQGRLALKAGSFVTGTTYRGAADPNGPKWWSTWTTYLRN